MIITMQIGKEYDTASRKLLDMRYGKVDFDPEKAHELKLKINRSVKKLIEDDAHDLISYLNHGLSDYEMQLMNGES